MPVEPSSVRWWVGGSVHTFKHEFLSEASFGWGLIALGFVPGRFELWFPWQNIAPIGL